MRQTILLGAAALLLMAAVGCSSYNQEPSAAPEAATSAGTAAALAATPPGCATTPASIPSSIPGVPSIPAGVQTVTTPSGLRYADLNAGTGDVAKSGQSATVQYTGWLPDGTKFDSSLDRNQPFTFPLGGGQVIKGWDEGVAGMKVGGERLLIVPPDLGYGPRGAGAGKIPPCATLIFDVHLMSVK